MRPFWPRVSPHFLACRQGVRGAGLAEQCFVGLSGGPDSLALLAAAVAEGHQVTALCIDHGLQGGSRSQAAAAAAQANDLGAAARVITVDVPAAERAALGVEAAARRARYRAFAEAAKPALGDRTGRAGEVAVAHTAEDQAETLLLSALRGKVSGMLQRTEIEGAQVVRPLLEIRRADTEGACTELGLQPWRDPHNADPNFRRVAVRQQVLPLLQEIHGGDVVPALALAGARAAADDAALAQPGTADCNRLAAMDEPRRRRAIAAWLTAQGVEVTGAAMAGIGKLCTDWHGQGGVAVGAADPAGIADRRLEVVRVGGKLALLSGH